MGPTLWLLLVVFAFGLLKGLGRVTNGKLKFFMSRLAAFAFVGAGVLGASGWIGSASAAVVAWTNHTAAAAGGAALGTGAVWIIWGGLVIVWIFGLLPESWFSWDIPDWLSISGLLLPALAASIPGPFGGFARSLFGGIGEFMVEAARSLIGQGA